MYAIIANFGDDSIALIQWAYENKLNDVHVLSVDTGWQGEQWEARCELADKWIKALEFTHQRLKPEHDFSTLVEARKQFPSQKFHWCAGFLKGMAILSWLEEHDEDFTATVLLPNQRSMSKSQFDLPFKIEESERYDDRAVSYPLYAHSKSSRDALIEKTPFKTPLNHRSLECQACIHFTQQDTNTLTKNDIQRIEALESKVNTTMFDKPFSAYLADKKNATDKNYYDEFAKTCSWDYGCGL
ncbi:hypothetical protein [Fangia hongkongensis]|uniref:hypothetical protein n=1 Tax=Fangia hongkongensis TaxID=270495 RepID=UPI00037BE898|nr:hypothetical protein [Fangia hongkongensis]MBK2124138.1 hypothetical protein [Fangia hongkongensis]